MPFNEFIQTRLIDPMGLKYTSFAPREDLRNNLGIGYMWRYDTTELTEAPVFELGIWAGRKPVFNYRRPRKIYSYTVRHQRDERLIAQCKVTAGNVDGAVRRRFKGFGIGFHVSDHNGLSRIGHAGMIYGYSSAFMPCPVKK